MNWYYAHDGQQAGPVPDEELARLAQNGTVQPSTLVWHGGLSGWQAFSEVSSTLPGAPALRPAMPLAGGALAPRTVGAGQAVCEECGGVFPADEVVNVGGHAVCALCKPLLIQKMQQGSGDVGRYGVGGFRFAGFWIRLGAAIVDALILVPFSLLLNFIFTMSMGGFGRMTAVDPQNPTVNSTLLAGLAVYYVVVLSLTATYNGICMSRWGAMPGMLICGLRVIRPDGQKLTFLRGVGRFFANYLSGIIMCIGYLFIVFDDQKRALHDYICDTRVVYK